MNDKNSATYPFIEILNERKKEFEIDFGDLVCWLPKSQIEFDQEVQEVRIPDWLARDRGLI